MWSILARIVSLFTWFYLNIKGIHKMQFVKDKSKAWSKNELETSAQLFAAIVHVLHSDAFSSQACFTLMKPQPWYLKSITSYWYPYLPFPPNFKASQCLQIIAWLLHGWEYDNTIAAMYRCCIIIHMSRVYSANDIACPCLVLITGLSFMGAQKVLA